MPRSCCSSRMPDSGHTGTISIMVRMRRTTWNAMKPRIQCVLTQSNPGSTASGAGAPGLPERGACRGEGPAGARGLPERG